MLSARGRFDPLVDPERHQRLLQTLDERAGTQRGKPRRTDPSTNPLGSRIFDMHCGWPMYRQPYNQTFRYLCGFYQQSSGAGCKHHSVDGIPCYPIPPRLCAAVRVVAGRPGKAGTEASDHCCTRGQQGVPDRESSRPPFGTGAE